MVYSLNAFEILMKRVDDFTELKRLISRWIFKAFSVIFNKPAVHSAENGLFYNRYSLYTD